MSSPPLLQGPLITQPNFPALYCLRIGKTEELPQQRQTKYTSHQCIPGGFLPLTGIHEVTVTPSPRSEFDDQGPGTIILVSSEKDRETRV